jgi:tol-pal system protein YbgF
MKYSCLYLCLSLCVLTAPASAGLFSDDEARLKAQQLDLRLTKSEAGVTQKLLELTTKLSELTTQMEASDKQQTRALVDLQSQIEAQGNEARQLRGQNEALVHDLQDAEKRQKDFYVDLDGRLRHVEAGEVLVVQPEVSGDKTTGEADPALENRAYEAAYRAYKAGNGQNAVKAFQAFVKNFPESVYVSHAYLGMGNAYFSLADYPSSLASYQVLLGKYPSSVKASEAWLGVAACQQALKDLPAAKKTLKQLLVKYPDGDIAAKAKQQLSTLK